MPDYTVASTTDDQAAVNQAAGAITTPEVEEKEPQKQPEPQKEPERTSDPAEKSIKKMEKRIDRLTAERSSAQEEAASLRQRLQALEQASKQPVQPPTPPAPVQPPPETVAKPKQDDFQTYEEYVEAVADWKFEQRMAKMAAEEEQRVQAEAQRELQQSFVDRKEEFKKTHTDWDQVMGSIPDSVMIPPGVGPTLMEIENGPEVTYYLAKHLDVIKKLNTMTPHAAVAEIGRLSATIGRDEAINTPGFRTDRLPVSSAPAPITPLTGHSTKSTKDLGEMDYSEYRRIRDQQEKSRYKR